MSGVLKKFGRYFLLDQMAQGGMAEIYRARLASMDGAGRLLVIKRIQSGYGNNAEFLQMFKSEIKVTMGFNHPNIVQLYDFGEENGQPYIAMEFVDGKNLRQFIHRFTELKHEVPIELAAYVIEQAACGLFYAHSFKDKLTGKPLNIVHRDISPQNILISYEGNVKVIDFGIAKAAINVEATRVGVIKGKPSYLSPEQISGDPLDGRSDIFSLGTVLWEVLTGKKLFSGENDLSVLKLIESCQSHVKAPSLVNPNVPKELDYIVLKALAKHPEKRFQTAEEFQRALHKFLYSYMPDFNPSDLGYYAKDIFADDIVQDRKRVQRLNESAEKLLAAKTIELFRGSAKEGSAAPRDTEDTTIAGIASQRVRNKEPVMTDVTPKRTERSVQPEGHTVTAQGETRTPMLTSADKLSRSIEASGWNWRTTLPGQTRPSRQGFSLRAVVFWASLILVTVGIFVPDLGVRVPYVSDFLEDWTGIGSAQLVVEGNDRNVTVSVNGKNVSSSLPVTIKRLGAGKPIELLVTGAGGSFEQTLNLKRGEKKTVSVALSQNDQKPVFFRTPAGQSNGKGQLRQPLSLVPGKTIRLKVNVAPAGGRPAISVSGIALSTDNPELVVPLDQTLELVVERPGFRRLRREFYIDSRQAGGSSEYSMDAQLEAQRYGFLSIHTTPSADALINIDGALWKRRTPFERQRIPAGRYAVRLVNEILGMEKTVSVTVQEGKIINLDESLEIRE